MKRFHRKRRALWPFLVLAVAIGSPFCSSRGPRNLSPIIILLISALGSASRTSAMSLRICCFFLAGVWGLAFLFGKSNHGQFLDPRERWPYVLVFVGLVLTAFGSAYYHLAPDNARLVWDRLPMTIVFMPLVAALIAERVNLKLGLTNRDWR